jgi:hypothetical protein
VQGRCCPPPVAMQGHLHHASHHPSCSVASCWHMTRVWRVTVKQQQQQQRTCVCVFSLLHTFTSAQHTRTYTAHHTQHITHTDPHTSLSLWLPAVAHHPDFSWPSADQSSESKRIEGAAQQGDILLSHHQPHICICTAVALVSLFRVSADGVTALISRSFVFLSTTAPHLCLFPVSAGRVIRVT